MSEHSIFTWLSDWWRQTFTVTGTRIMANAPGVTAVSENKAKAIGDGKFVLTVTYKSNSSVPCQFYTTVFAGANGTGQKNDTARENFTLPASPGTLNTYHHHFDISDRGESFRPIFRSNAAITIEDISVKIRPEPAKLVGFDTTAIVGPAPRPQRLTVNAQAGDSAVLFVSSAWGNCPHRPPAGWEYKLSASVGASGRSGYVAVKKIESPAELVNLNPWNEGETSESSARDQATLVVVRTDLPPTLNEWTPEVPKYISGDLMLVASANHGAVTVDDVEWRASGSVQIQAGGKSTEASWSSQKVQLVESIIEDQAEIPAWASVVFAKARVYTFKVYHEGREKNCTVVPMPYGKRTVDDLLSKKPFVVAHRGGSLDWPEMSMRAYTNAVAHGVDALEFSCHKSKDGVWFGVHDRNLQRIHPGAPNTDCWELTWDDVQKYRTQGEPILRIEQILEAYGDSHVIFMDPKHSASAIDEFFDILDKNKHIIKFSADATWVADRARAKGFKTWGYAYSSHLASGQFAQWAPHWDILGMEITETMAPFEQAQSVIGDKPLMAHIIPNKAWYDRYAGSAAGIMVSGVASVKERSLV